MTPLEINIALHYWTTPEHWKGSPSRWTALEAKIITEFHQRHMLEIAEGGEAFTGNTPAMRCYVEALQAIPLPVVKWVIPDDGPASHVNPAREDGK